MNPLEKMPQYQLLLIKEMMKRNEWQIYKSYINCLVWDYLNTPESKDFLRGIKFALTKFESEIERI